MARYRVYLRTTASTTIEVEADTPDEAVDAAYGEPMPRLCAHCSGWGTGQNLELNDAWEILDGPLSDSVEEVTDADA
jgi:hypothetical protein